MLYSINIHINSFICHVIRLLLISISMLLISSCVFAQKGRDYLSIADSDTVSRSIRVHYLGKALTAFEEENEIDGALHCCHQLAANYLAIGAQEKSIEILEKGVSLAKKHDRNKQLGYMLRIKSIAHLYNNNTSLAHNEASRMLELGRELQDTTMICLAHECLCAILEDEEREFEGIGHAREIIRLSKPGHTSALALSNIANFFLRSGEIDSALTYAYKSEKNLNFNNVMGENPYTTLFQAHLKKENLDSAYYYLKMLDSVAIGSQVVENMLIAKKSYADYYYALSDLKNAYNAIQTYYEMKDSVDEAWHSEKLSELMLIYDSQEKERELEIERSKSAKLEADNKNLELEKIALFLALGAVALIVLFSLYILYNWRQKTKHARRLLEEKTEELTEFAYEIGLVQNNISAWLDSHKSLKKHVNSEGMSKYMELTANLKSQLKSDYMSRISDKIAAEHNKFFQKMEEVHPGLSDAEKELCVFLRNDLSSKQIAAIRHISPKSVEVARTRLRKKLKLTNTEINLQEYLSKI